jgi:hypothetical protein
MRMKPATTSGRPCDSSNVVSYTVISTNGTEHGIKVVIPGKSNCTKRIRYDKESRLKDWRRIATRYDKLARNYLSALYFVAWPSGFDSIESRPLAREALECISQTHRR